jgi:RNA polymerase sigma-70 factor (ECF subfamily)
MATGEMALGGAEAVQAAPPALAEAGLLEACRRGDPGAFAELVSLHQGLVYNLALRLLGEPEEARDLAQDVFLKVYRMLGSFRGQSALRTWIYRIVVNESRNRQRWWRRRRRERSLPLEALPPADSAQLLAEETGETSPYEAVRRRERSARVQAALQGLSFEHRAVLLLREVEEMSCDEIAAALGLPEGTVKSRLSRAREALRQALARGGGEQP